MREFLNIRGCLKHILTANQLMFSPISPSSHSSGLFYGEVTQLSELGWSKGLAYTMSCRLAKCGLLKKCPHPSYPHTVSIWLQWSFLIPQHYCFLALMWFSVKTDHVPMSHRDSYCHNQCSHGWNDLREYRDWQWTEWDQGLKGLWRVKRVVRVKIKTCCKECQQHHHGLKWDMGTPPTHTTLNYACSHSPLDSEGRSHMRPSLQLDLLYTTSCQAELCWEPTNLSTQPWDQPAIHTELNATFDNRPNKKLFYKAALIRKCCKAREKEPWHSLGAWKMTAILCKNKFPPTVK